MSKKALYKLHFDCGRQGILTGLFVQDPSKVKKLVDSKEEIYFGEALGKHSEIIGPLGDVDYTFITDDPKVIKVVEEFELETGIDPIQTYIDDCADQGKECVFDVAESDRLTKE